MKRSDDSLHLLSARQDLQELRDERRIFSAAFELVVRLREADERFDEEAAQKSIQEISKGIEIWPRQWNREKERRGKEPLWRLKSESAQRIKQFPIGPLERRDGRIVISELVNVFPGLTFPNPLEMHSYIRFGIRPLLYSALRREFLYERSVSICANDHCRRFFEIDRTGKRHCTDICSRQHRQREYWAERGRDRRTKRRLEKS
jgi:hypothetical protein